MAEKYGNFRDAMTGLAPFIPYTPPRRPKTLVHTVLLFFKRYILGILLSLIRILLSLPVLPWLLVMAGIAVLIPIKMLKRAFRRYFYALGTRFLLFSLGFWWIPATWSDRSLKNRLTERSVENGDVLVCNHISYIDILYLAFRFAPVFTRMGENGLVVPVSFWGALRDAVSPRLPGKEGVPLRELVTKKEAPIVVFLEGTTSNGEALLPFLEHDLEVPAQVWLCGFKLRFIDFSPAFTAGSVIVHVFRTACQFHNTFSVQFKPVIGGEEEMVESAMCKMLRLKTVALTVEDKIDFMKKWNED